MAYRYFILDSQNIPLARALLLSPPDTTIWELEVLDNAIEAVLEHEMLQLVGMDEKLPAKKGRILRGRGDKIALEPMDTLGDEIRKNLRVQARFDTYIYPITGAQKSRIPVLVNDLSSGGIAFFCIRKLEPGDQLEIVIPITSNPIILKVQVIRPRPSASRIQLYAAKFVDTIDDEDRMLREAVFGLQIRNQRSS